MKKIRYIEIFAEVKLIENKLDILDPNNPIELNQISILKNRLDALEHEVKNQENKKNSPMLKVLTNVA